MDGFNSKNCSVIFSPHLTILITFNRNVTLLSWDLLSFRCWDIFFFLRINNQKRCPFPYGGLEWKSRKSGNTWSNRQIWPWSREWSRAKANRALPRECTHQDIKEVLFWTIIGLLSDGCLILKSFFLTVSAPHECAGLVSNPDSTLFVTHHCFYLSYSVISSFSRLRRLKKKCFFGEETLGWSQLSPPLNTPCSCTISLECWQDLWFVSKQGKKAKWMRNHFIDYVTCNYNFLLVR